MTAKGLVGICIVAALCGCHRQSQPLTPSSTSGTITERTVFTDSLLHAERCQPPKVGEDWRRVCTPLDQAAPRPVRPRP